jgi:hypothetical protein
MFQAQIGRNMEVYVDDMLVKSTESVNHVHDLHKAFETLKRYGMKLNPTKCAFGVSSGKFLGYMVSSRGIEANPEKIQAVLEMQSPKTTKQLQQLIGRLVALNQFISRSTDKCLPFFKILRKAFEWSKECEEAFSQLKMCYTYIWQFLLWQSMQLWFEKMRGHKSRSTSSARHYTEQKRDIPK